MYVCMSAPDLESVIMLECFCGGKYCVSFFSLREANSSFHHIIFQRVFLNRLITIVYLSLGALSQSLCYINKNIVCDKVSLTITPAG